MKNFPLADVHKLLGASPVILVTTSLKGRANVMTMAWYTMLDFKPPLIACVMGKTNLSFEALKKTGECVIAIPAAKMAGKVVNVGSSSGKEVDKFAKFKLTALPAKAVDAPLIGECFANIECRVVDKKMVEKYDLFILEAVKAWIDPAQKNPKMLHHKGGAEFIVDGKIVSGLLKK